MEINFVSDKYKESIKHILTYCFENPSDLGEYFINEDFTPENCLGYFDGDKLCGMVNIYPYDMFFHGKTVSMGGIGVVSTLPEYRHCHCASNLLIKSLEAMRDRGYIFSALAPFSYSFYRKYGWELGFDTKNYRIPIDRLRGMGIGKGQFRPLTLGDINGMSKLYENSISKYNGAICRDSKSWESRLKRLGENRGYGYGYSRQANGLDGYILYSMNEGVFNIHEMICDSLETKLELMRFIYYHSAQVREVVWRAPQDDNTVLLLDNPRIEQKIETGMMIRVIDVKKALEAYTYPLVYKGSFTIKVEDKYAPWNSETFRIFIGEGAATVEHAGDAPIDVECDIQAFSQIIFGYIGMGEAITLGKITAHNPGLLDDMEIIFKSHGTHMTDSF